MEWLAELFKQYGYMLLLLGLPLDFIALPIPPAQTTITLAGYMSYVGEVYWWLAWPSAFAGSIIGFTCTYGIGYAAGAKLLDRFGERIGITKERLEKTRNTYEKHGNKLLFINFFIPGLRQFTGYSVGILRIPYRTFALYAYPGAALWTGTFFAIGYFFGEQWEIVFAFVERFIKIIVILAVVVLAAVLAVRRLRRRK